MFFVINPSNSKGPIDVEMVSVGASRTTLFHSLPGEGAMIGVGQGVSEIAASNPNAGAAAVVIGKLP